MNAILARAGTVTCKDGSPFATVARDIHRGAVMHPDDLVFVDGSKPFSGETISWDLLDFLTKALR